MKRSVAARLLSAGFVLLLSIMAGCIAINRPPAIPYDSAASLYEEAQLTYRVDAGKLHVPVSVARIEGRQVSYEQVPGSFRERESSGVLAIQYPHPQHREGYALARVTIESKVPGAETTIESAAGGLTAKMSATARKVPLVGSMIANDPQIEETWELDVPRAQLDHIIARMNDQRYFERHATRSDTVSVVATIDGSEVKKNWDRIEELDQLMVAVRSQGRLVSYQRGEGVDQIAQPTASSVTAYRAYAAQDAVNGGNTSGFLAGGPVLPGVSADPSLPPAYHSVDPRTIAGTTPVMQAPYRQPQLTRLPMVDVAPAR